jgi:hypothetical protein
MKDRVLKVLVRDNVDRAEYEQVVGQQRLVDAINRPLVLLGVFGV